jgi:hypothetical protein
MRDKQGSNGMPAICLPISVIAPVLSNAPNMCNCCKAFVHEDQMEHKQIMMVQYWLLAIAG